MSKRFYSVDAFEKGVDGYGHLLSKHIPENASMIRFAPLLGKAVKETTYQDAAGGFFVGSYWNGSYHDAWTYGPFVFAWTVGRKKRMKRLNRLFQEAKSNIKGEIVPVDPCTRRFRARQMVREGD